MLEDALYLLKTLDEIYIYIYLDEQFLFKHLKSGAACATIADMNNVHSSPPLSALVPGPARAPQENFQWVTYLSSGTEERVSLHWVCCWLSQKGPEERWTEIPMGSGVFHMLNSAFLGGSQAFKIPNPIWLNGCTLGLGVQYCCASDLMLCLHDAISDCQC